MDVTIAPAPTGTPVIVPAASNYVPTACTNRIVRTSGSPSPSGNRSRAGTRDNFFCVPDR